jgi:hypothetical protein
MYKRTLLEIFLDIMSDSDLYEMAETRKDAIKMVNSKSYQIYQHMIKLKTLNSPIDRNHWIQEIYIWISEFEDIKLKPKNKRLSYDQLHEWFWIEGHEFHWKDLEKKVNRLSKYEYKNIKILRTDYKQIHTEIYNEINHMLKDISNNKFTHVEDYV